MSSSPQNNAPWCPRQLSAMICLSLLTKKGQRGLELTTELDLERISSPGKDRSLGESEWLSLPPGRHISWKNHLPSRNGFTHGEMCSPALPRDTTQVDKLGTLP